MSGDVWDGRGGDEMMKKEAGDAAGLDSLLQWSLQTWLRGEEPSDRVWQRIQSSLNGGPVAFPERRRRPWRRVNPLAQMMGLAAMFIALVGVIINVNLTVTQPAGADSSWQSLSSSKPVTVSAEDALSSRIVFARQQQQLEVQRGLAPAGDPLLIHRHWSG